jgi:uncharacterized protein (TIGR02466 family)
MKTITPAFPCLIYEEDETKDFHLFQDRFVNYAYNQEKKNPNGGKKSNVGGWQTSDPKFFINDQEFQPLFNWLADRVKDYIEFVDYDKEAIREVEIKSIWLNINRRFNSNSCHWHPNSNLSGVLYIKAPKDCGRIFFESPHEFTEFNAMHVQKQHFIEKYLAWRYMSIEPKEGSLIIFPSHLRHFVNPNQSTGDRISLAFNMNINVG